MFETQSLSCLFKDINEPSQDKNETIVTKYGSCKFLNTPLPCINKAIHHLQELELKMEKCFQQYNNVFKEKMQWVTEQVSAECIKDIWVSISTELDYKDADVSCEDGKTLTLKQETEALLLEVTELIKRLEADCEEAEKALELEKQRRKKLTMKIDQMSLWRLQELPAAVQKEYDMCVQDILELQCNIDCKSHHLQQVQNQILKLETVNRKIQEDIDFMKKHSPLLEEKLNLEEKAVNDVLLAYEKISKLYGDIHCELMEIQETMKSIEKESEQKIKSMCEKVKYAEMKLNQYKNELKHSEFIWTEYCMKLKETEEKIIKDEKHLEELLKQKAEIQEDAKCWNSKIEDLIRKINVQEEESIKMSDASSEVIKALEELKSMRENYLQNMKQKLLNMNKALVVLKRENEELEGENEELLQKITTSSVKKMYQSEVETTCKNISNLEQQLERANEDLCNTELSYSEKCRKYEDLKESQAAEEMSYKKSEQNLNKEIEHQKGVWKAIQSRIKAIYEELEEKKKEKIKKTKEDMKRIEERERQVADLETKLKRHKAVFKDNCKKLSHLDKNIQELEKQQKQTEQQLEQSISILQQQLNDIQEKVLFTSSQIDENSHTMENFKKELQELNELWNIMEIQMENTEKSFAALGKNLSVVMFKQQSTKKVFDRLQHELAEYEEKVKKEEKNYGELLQIKKKNLKDSEAALEQIIKENLCLAQEYQVFQYYYLNSKDDLSELCENRIRMEAATRYHQQVRGLQGQLRGVLDGQRSWGGPSIPPGLARIQADSQENAQKTLAAQGELSDAIQHVTSFLHSDRWLAD